MDRSVHSLWRSRWCDVLAVGAILLSVLALFRDAILNGWVFYEFDTNIYYYPLAKWIASSLAEGRIPLWTPNIYSGFPLFADGEGGVFYPPNLVLLWALGAQRGFIWLAVLHFFMAGAFTYAFVRLLQPNRFPAVIAGLTFALGSFTVTQMHHVNVVNSAAWLPLILVWIELALRSSGRRLLVYTALAGTTFGVQLLTIHIQPILMTLLIAGFYVLFRVVFGGSFDFRKLGSALSVCVVAAGVGAALSAIQLLPLADLADHSARGDGATYEFGSSFGIAPVTLITAIFPYFFRISGYEYWSLWFRWETTLYVGIAPLCLALIAVVLRRSRTVLFFAFLALLGTLLAMGDYSPINLYSLWWHLPGFDFLRAPGRFTLIVTFSLAVLAGLGAAHLQTSIPSATRATRVAILRMLAILSALAIILFAAVSFSHAWLEANRGASTALIEQWYLAIRHQTDLRFNSAQIYAALQDTLAWDNMRTNITFVSLLATVFAIYAWLKWQRSHVVCQSLLALIVAADLLSFAVIYHPQTPVSKIDSNTEGAPEFLALRQGLHRVFNQQPMGLMSPNRLLPLGIETVGGYSSLVGKRYTEYMKGVRRGKTALLDLWNVRYVVTPKKGVPPGPPDRYRPVFEDRNNVVYENSKYLPRAFIVKNALSVNTGETALQTMEKVGFDPRRFVVIERDDAPAKGSPESPDAKSGAAGRARITQYAPDRIKIELNAISDGYLVLSDAFDPGWQATLDGQPATVYRADYLFRALKVTQGLHTAVFNYEPAGLRTGSVISGGTLLALIGLSVVLYVGPRSTGLAKRIRENRKR